MQAASTRTSEQRKARGRAKGDRGAALPEFALVAVLLLTLIFGTITFGVLLSFRQDLTRAAAEGARAGAVAFPASNALTDAEAATDEAVDQAGKTCGVDGMACDVSLRDCNDAAPPSPLDGFDDPLVDNCVFVRLDYDNNGFPILPEVPLIAAFLPDTIVAKSVARTN